MNQYELVQWFQVYWAVGKGGDIVLGEQVRGRGTARLVREIGMRGCLAAPPRSKSEERAPQI